MANKSNNSGNGKSANQQNRNEVQNTFSQGTGDNNTRNNQDKQSPATDQHDSRKSQPVAKNQPEKGKLTNQNNRVTNKDLPVKNEQNEKMPVDDDSDRTHNRTADEPEVDMPAQQPETTEKKIPKM